MSAHWTQTTETWRFCCSNTCKIIQCTKTIHFKLLQFTAPDIRVSYYLTRIGVKCSSQVPETRIHPEQYLIESACTRNVYVYSSSVDFKNMHRSLRLVPIYRNHFDENIVCKELTDRHRGAQSRIPLFKVNKWLQIKFTCIDSEPVHESTGTATGYCRAIWRHDTE